MDYTRDSPEAMQQAMELVVRYSSQKIFNLESRQAGKQGALWQLSMCR
jgi:hypothetical protein